jgi:hypothetical protein
VISALPVPFRQKKGFFGGVVVVVVLAALPAEPVADPDAVVEEVVVVPRETVDDVVNDAQLAAVRGDGAVAGVAVAIRPVVVVELPHAARTNAANSTVPNTATPSSPRRRPSSTSLPMPFLLAPR